MLKFIYPAVYLCFLSLSPAPAFAEIPDNCTARIAGWLHWNAQRHESIVCDSDQAYMIDAMSEQRDAVRQRMLLCRIPKDSNTMQYRLIRTDYRQLPVYSSAAIHCLQKNRGLILKQQQMLQHQLDQSR